MKRSYLLAPVAVVGLWSLAGCGGPRTQPAPMAPPVAQSAPMNGNMNGGMNGNMNGGMNGGMGGNMPVSNQRGGVYNWQDVPVNQQVGIQSAQFDQGGYQLITDSGDTIVVPFANQNLYVMKFGRTNGQPYFVNEGGAPTLYLSQNFGLANANAQGALWYPIPANYNYTRPMYVGLAPTWSDYMGMGWYPGMRMYGGMYGYNPGSFVWMPGFNINIGGSPYYGWNSYHSYYMGHPGYYRPSVVYNNYNTAPRGTGSYRYTGSYGNNGRNAGSFGSRPSTSTGSFGSRPSGSTGSFGSRPSGTFGSRPTGAFGNSGGSTGSFGGARPTFNSGTSSPSGGTFGSRPSSGSFGSRPSSGSFGSGGGGYSSRPTRSSGGSFGGGSVSRPSGGGSFSRPSGGGSFGRRR